MCLDALLFPPRLCCRFRADIRHPLAGGPSPTRGAFPTWSLSAISANTGMTDRASQCTPHPSLTCPVTWCDIAHRAERSIGGHRALTCAGRPGHGPETAAMPRRSWRVRNHTRQESTRSQPHCIHPQWCGLTDSCGICGILLLFYFLPRAAMVGPKLSSQPLGIVGRLDVCARHAWLHRLCFAACDRVDTYPPPCIASRVLRQDRSNTHNRHRTYHGTPARAAGSAPPRSRRSARAIRNP